MRQGYGEGPASPPGPHLRWGNLVPPFGGKNHSAVPGGGCVAGPSPYPFNTPRFTQASGSERGCRRHPGPAGLACFRFPGSWRRTKAAAQDKAGGSLDGAFIRHRGVTLGLPQGGSRLHPPQAGAGHQRGSPPPCPTTAASCVFSAVSGVAWPRPPLQASSPRERGSAWPPRRTAARSRSWS